MSTIYPPGHIVGGRYRVTSALSQGGMGAVYLAQQISLGRDVALKVMLERGNDPELTKRFDVEARAVCMLKHPNIITYHDYGRDEDGHPFLVMEFLPGYPGTKLVYGDRRASLRDLVHIIAQTCSALNEAHQKGIVHRDLKWSNIMVCPQSHDPYFSKLIDFGIMKVATDGSSGDQRQLTVTGMLLGTPEYMSPEAICGMPIDGRADQYSLAVMLWEALEGARPFQGATQFELLRQQVQDEPPAFEDAKPLLADYPDLEGVVRQAMEKHPDDRFATILEFRDALLAAIGMQTDKTGSAHKAMATPRRVTGQVDTRAPKTGQPIPKSKRMTGQAPVAIDTAHRTAREAAPQVEQKSSKMLLIVAAIVLLGAGAAIAALIVVAGSKNDQPTAISVASTTATDAQDAPDIAVAGTQIHASEAPPTVAATQAATTPATSAQPTAPPVEDVVASAPETTPTVADTVVAAADTELTDVVESPADTVVAVADVAPSKPDAGPAKPQAEGSLLIQAQPYAVVSVNGKKLGNTPQTYKAKGGTTVTVTFEYAFGAGGKVVKQQTRKIKANEKITVFQKMVDD